MSKRKHTDIEYKTIGALRNSVREELREILPDLRHDAVELTIHDDPDLLELRAEISGDTTPYTPEEVAYFVGELGANIVETVPVQ